MPHRWRGLVQKSKTKTDLYKVCDAEVFTRACMNKTFVRGVPSYNNALEAQNGALKRDVQHKRHSTAAFVKVIMQ